MQLKRFTVTGYIYSICSWTHHNVQTIFFSFAFIFDSMFKLKQCRFKLLLESDVQTIKTIILVLL